VSNAPSKPVSFSRPKVGYFSNRPRTVIRSEIIKICKILTNHNYFKYKDLQCIQEDDLAMGAHT
jgi:hypothetical protein